MASQGSGVGLQMANASFLKGGGRAMVNEPARSEGNMIPMHAEMGFLKFMKPTTDDCVAVEFALAHPFGVVEMEKGEVGASMMEVGCTDEGMLRGPSSEGGKEVARIRRVFQRAGEDGLGYEVFLQIQGQSDEPVLHLKCDMKRVED
eukprot:CAMPEP_0181341134 /NCGR_PEP_ID=MMETSP1101-20121128/30235_1 /TAXON_ID=46948 /ORGANISM="Rhodomonas abbreviata, Strain Caron Lab Isolate" /LENGTH=146 /DNA_ID=CAMNT_0023452365 /DNA_START=12 /DNA_END=453 /DNA_ORIENTATION=+